MEIENRNVLLVCIYETLGTAVLLYSCNVCKGGSPMFVSGVLFCLVTVCGKISGAHFNPAITLAVLVKNSHFSRDFGLCILIIICQLVGAAIGIMAAYLPINKQITIDDFSLKYITLAQVCSPLA